MLRFFKSICLLFIMQLQNSHEKRKIKRALVYAPVYNQNSKNDKIAKTKVSYIQNNTGWHNAQFISYFWMEPLKMKPAWKNQKAKTINSSLSLNLERRYSACGVEAFRRRSAKSHWGNTYRTLSLPSKQQKKTAKTKVSTYTDMHYGQHRVT